MAMRLLGGVASGNLSLSVSGAKFTSLFQDAATCPKQPELVLMV
jgi:hypothetical protein